MAQVQMRGMVGDEAASPPVGANEPVADQAVERPLNRDAAHGVMNGQIAAGGQRAAGAELAVHDPVAQIAFDATLLQRRSIPPSSASG